MDTDKGQYMTRKIIDHAQELQKPVSLPGSPHATHVLPHYLSLCMPKILLSNWNLGRSSTTVIQKERTIHGSLEHVSH